MNIVQIPESLRMSKNGKEYTVYKMLIEIQGRTHEVQKRYSELFEMHKYLKKKLKVPQFPPKQMRNQNSKFIEARKAGLQSYFRWIVANEPHCKLFLELLKIPNIPHSNFQEIQSLDSLDSETSYVTHRPVIYFKAEVVESMQFSNLQDNVVSGVFAALYS